MRNPKGRRPSPAERMRDALAALDALRRDHAERRSILARERQVQRFLGVRAVYKVQRGALGYQVLTRRG